MKKFLFILLIAFYILSSFAFASNKHNTVKLLKNLSSEEKEYGAIAWRYFINNYNPQTGFINISDNYSFATTWDIGSYLFALYSAYELGLVHEIDFNQRLRIILKNLGRIPLYNNELPNRSYDTRTLAIVDYTNKSSKKGIGWSATDLGRLLMILKELKVKYPEFASDIDRVVRRWTFSRLFKGGQMYGTLLVDDKEYYYQQGRTGDEQYGAKGFAMWDFQDEVRVALKYNNIKFVEVYSQEIPCDNRGPEAIPKGHNIVTSQIAILEGLEYGETSPFWEYGKRIYKVQEDRYSETGILTAVSEDHIDCPPWFVFNTIYTDGKLWAVVMGDEVKTGPSIYRFLCTDTSFAWKYLYNTSYSKVVFNAVKDMCDPERGFYSGIWEDGGGPNKSITCNTNAVILESLLYYHRGAVLTVK